MIDDLDFNSNSLENYLDNMHSQWKENILDDDDFAIKLSKIHDFLDRKEQTFTVRRLVKKQSSFTGEIINKRGRLF